MSLFRIGDYAEISKIFFESDVMQYAEISGDNNPLHVDKDYARETIFNERIIQGMLIASIISSVIGTKLPGPGSIYLTQNLKFIKPVKINEKITARVEIENIDYELKRLSLKTICYNDKDINVLEGNALVKYPLL